MKHINLIICIFLFCAMHSMVMEAQSYRITSIEPNGKIKIGDKECAVGNIFDANEIIYWPQNQAGTVITARCVSETCVYPKIIISEKVFEKYQLRDASLSTYFTKNALVGFGETMDESISKDTLLLKNELRLDCNSSLDECEYYGYLSKRGERISLTVENGQIVIKKTDLEKYGREIELWICFHNKVKRTEKREKYIILIR